MTFNFNSLAGAAALALLAGAASAQDYTMRISHQFPPTHHTAIRLEQFAADVAENTGGAVEVQLFGGAQLFAPQQHHAAVAGGEIEAAIILNLQWGGTIPEMAVALIPYLISSPAAQRAFVDSEAAGVLDEAMLEVGVRNIAWIVDTNDLVFTSNGHALESPQDFQGVKIRGLTPLFDQGLIALGAQTVAMPGSETYQSLQTGVIDAGVTGVAAAHSRRFFEVQDYARATAIMIAFDNMVVNPAWWEGLPTEIRDGIQTAADAAVESSITPFDGVDPANIEALTNEGMDAAVLSDEQIAALREIMQPAVREAYLAASGERGARLLELIEGM